MHFPFVCDKIFKIYCALTGKGKLKNVVANTAFKTVLIVIAAIIIAFATASLGFPQHMATMFEDMGAYSFATGYAGLAYKYSGTVENLARCVDDSILAADDANIINYGDKLVKRKDFISYSEKRTAASNGVNYYHFVYGKLACAKYNRGKKEGALKAAQTSMQNVSDFPVNNALGLLSARAFKKSDIEFCRKLSEEIGKFNPSDEQQQKYYDAVISILTEITE